MPEEALREVLQAKRYGWKQMVKKESLYPHLAIYQAIQEPK